MKSMILVGITGRSGSGKTLVSSFFTKKGYTVIDTDKISHNIMNKGRECVKAVSEYFGSDILDENGELIRTKLAQKAFINESETKKLMSITHPFIMKNTLKMLEKAQKNSEKIVFLDGAVIIGSEFEKLCDKIIAVITNEKTELDRIIKRDSLSLEQAKERISRQISYEILYQKSDYLIENNKSIDELFDRANIVLEKILGEVDE